MTSFSTCAHVGCTTRIAYDPKGYCRPRYCPEHEAHAIRKFGIKVNDAGNYLGWDSLFVRIAHPTVQPVVMHHRVVLKCPVCKIRTISEHYKEPCTTAGCNGTMIYHKDVL